MLVVVIEWCVSTCIHLAHVSRVKLIREQLVLLVVEVKSGCPVFIKGNQSFCSATDCLHLGKSDLFSVTLISISVSDF